jgi:hypothetical protein
MDTMPSKKNPLKLNKLQLRTLLLFQELARYPDTSTRDERNGEIMLSTFPHVHGDHVHIGSLVVLGRDASGFSNQAVWRALDRKGLARSRFPMAITLTPEGIAYDTGLNEKLVHQSDH